MRRLEWPLRSIFAKIFLWFCATILGTLVIVLAAASLLGSQPFGRRWMSLTQDLYAHSAVDFYQTGGRAGLEKYLEALKNSGIEGQLLDGSGRDVLERPLLDGAGPVLAQVKASGRSRFRLGRTWTAASPTSDGATTYTFVMEVHPLRGFVDGTFVNPLIPRLMLGILLVALFCLLLARHITEPIRVLEDAATQIAGGALSVRASPRIAPRRDELGRMAEAFDRMAERIQELIYSQQEMLGHISHELRSPLTRIGVSLELLRRGDPESLDQMQADLDRMNLMIGEILKITRMDLKRHEPEQMRARRLVELTAILDAMVRDATFEAQHQRKQVEFRSDAGCLLLGDAELLRSCCENVVRNALLYTPERSVIEITLTRRGDDNSAEILVRDDEPGVPAEAIPRLFDLFYRVDATRERHPEGTGMGLAIAQRIVTMHGGTIAARNVIPRGLEVRLVLPLLDAEAAKELGLAAPNR
jgi:two-component system sensor histidine kinase CpxA